MPKPNGIWKKVSVILTVVLVLGGLLVAGVRLDEQTAANTAMNADQQAEMRTMRKEMSDMAGDVKAIRLMLEHQAKETPP